MINKKLIFKILGALLFIESAWMFLCLVMALIYQEDDRLAFLISIITTTCFGFLFTFLGSKAENRLSRRDAYLVVSVTWIVFSLFGMLPFLISGYITDVSGAFLETMSGFTTTGATVLNNIGAMPHGLLFWRSLTHWLGGLGIVFFTIAVLPSFVTGDVKLFAAEATGPVKSKLQPRISITARWLWSVYLILTTGCILSLWLAGMGFFDSVCHACATTATGGFSTNPDSIRGYHSPAIEYVEIVFMFLSGVNFSLLYFQMVRGKFTKLFTNSEFRFYSLMVLVSTMFIAYLLCTRMGYGIEHAIRSALFQVVSLITTTGFYSDDFGLWPHITWLILTICMFVGSCAGSTAGGLKCVRVVMIFKILKNEFRRILHPKAVIPVRIDGATVTTSVQSTLMAFFTLYLLIILFSTILLLMMGINLYNSVTITISSISNVGPAMGSQIGPTQSWSVLPAAAKWLCSTLMLMGRLEIFSVLVLFSRGFWKDN